MKLRIIVPSIFLVIALCGFDKPKQTYFERFKSVFGGEVTDVQGGSDDYSTKLTNYKAVSAPLKTSRANGLYGIVKVFSEHEIRGIGHKGKIVTGNYVLKGAGSVVISDGRMFIVTSKHIVVPNTAIKSLVDKKDEKKKIEFEEITEIGAKVLVGYLGVIPEALWLSRQHDVAVLQIAQKDEKSVLDVYFPYQSVPIEIGTPLDLMRPGLEVESWGFPARQSPQIEKIVVASVDSEYFVLNRALLPGYSGGLVFIKTGETKSIGGVIFRADEQVNQTSVLPWNIAVHLLQAAQSNKLSSSIEKVELGNAVKLGNVAYGFNKFYDKK